MNHQELIRYYNIQNKKYKNTESWNIFWNINISQNIISDLDSSSKFTPSHSLKVPQHSYSFYEFCTLWAQMAIFYDWVYITSWALCMASLGDYYDINPQKCMHLSGIVHGLQDKYIFTHYTINWQNSCVQVGLRTYKATNGPKGELWARQHL